MTQTSYKGNPLNINTIRLCIVDLVHLGTSPLFLLSNSLIEVVFERSFSISKYTRNNSIPIVVPINSYIQRRQAQTSCSTKLNFLITFIHLFKTYCGPFYTLKQQ